jgi:hypothetical protein
LFGDKNVYSMRLRYFDDQRTYVKIDGIEGDWELTVLEGPYGPVDKYDLYIGGVVKVFGRHLTIASANASICHGIELRARKMKKQMAFMQERIENLGAVPIIRREPPTVMRHIQRSAKAEGHVDTRKLLIDVTKLAEQLCDLGLTHVVKEMGLIKVPR